MEMRLTDLYLGWVSGSYINDKLEEIRAQAEAEDIAYFLSLDYESISDFYIATGRKKEKEDGAVIA